MPTESPKLSLTPASMTVTVLKKSLSEGLGMLERVIPSRSSNPLLTSVLVVADTGGLTLSGTNLEIDLRCFVPAEVPQGASFVAPAHLFAQIVRNLPGEIVTLELRGVQLVMQAGGSDFNLQTGDLAAYPDLTFPDTTDAEIDSAELARSLDSVRYAASNEAFQAVFRGLKVEQHQEKVRVVASDGFRLALRDFTVPNTDQAERTLIVPARSADELVRMLRDGPAALTYGDGMLGVRTDRFAMTVKLLDGDFPDYERVIPKDIKMKVTLSAATLREAVSRVAVLADKNANNRVECVFTRSSDGDFTPGRLTLEAEGDYGRAQDVLSAETSGTESALTVGYNAKYLLDALEPIDGDVTVHLSGGSSPTLFTCSKDAGYMAVVVPLRV